MTTTKDVLLPLATSSLACSATLIELTIPQVVRLSRPTAEPLPATPLTARLAMLPRLIGPQTALTVVQFGFIRELRDAMDRWRGPHPLHLSLSYGLVSGPCRSAAYNLLIAGTYAHHGRASPGDFSIERFWRTKVVPGLAWSVLRDSGSVGGGIVVAPLVVPSDASPPVKFLGGLGCGACGGLCRISTPSSRCSYGDDVASMAWGVRNSISTQVAAWPRNCFTTRRSRPVAWPRPARARAPSRPCVYV